MRHRVALALAAVFAMVAGVFAPVPGALASNHAVLGITVEAVDALTSAPQTEASYMEHNNQVGYRISYSCAAADCAGATVRMSPSQPDPYGLLSAERMLSYANWTLPAGVSGATIGGTDTTGKTITLGDLPAGTSGTFRVVYDILHEGSYTTARPAQYYPSGFEIEMSATLTSSTATRPVTSDANPVTWTSEVPQPDISQSNPGSSRPGVDVSWQVAMGSGAFQRSSATRVVGTSEWTAAGSYTVVEKLDPRAVYVSSTGGGVYDSATHTVTWSTGTKENPSYDAAGGWGFSSNSGWTSRGPYYPRAVTVRYPASAFTSDPSGCNFEETVTSRAEVSLTYLDAERTTKTAFHEMSHLISCYDPFARARMGKDSTNNGSSGAVRMLNVPPDVAGTTCPPSGRDDWSRTCTPGQALAPFPDNTYYWSVPAYNESNVPGVAVIEDDTLGQADARVGRITTTATTPPATIEWTLDDGTTGASNGTANAPAGRWFTKAKVTSGAIAAPNTRPSDNRSTAFNASFHYTVTKDAPVGERRTNTARATMSWPDSGLDDMKLGPVSRTVQFRATPKSTQKPDFTAAFVSPAQVEGGGNAVPGKDVAFTVRGSTADVPQDADITPQYVFIAPAGWTVDPGSATFPANSVPQGLRFDYSTKTVGGVERDVVVATWPDDVSFGRNTTWPTMTVVAQPGFSVAAGTRSAANAWTGDSRHTWDDTQADYAGPVQDTTDVDGDGDTQEWFSSAAQNVLVSAADGLRAVKEICRPDAAASDGCAWISSPDEMVGVAPDATDIRYRVTLKNTGNTTLSDVVAYDVLPYAGDTGTSAGTADTPRGSTFDESLSDVLDVSANLRLAYSASTNPKRDQVYPSAPGAVDDWGPGHVGKKAIRATVQGNLTPGQTAVFGFVASVNPGAVADAVACNSVALDSAQTLPAEPRPVCATTQEADLSVSVPDRLPLQVGRPGVVPFTVENGGGSQESAATVTVSVPAGLTVTGLAPRGWACTTGSNTTPYAGPVTLTCKPVDDDGEPAKLKKDVGVPLDIPVVPTSAGTLCVPASVTGLMTDPDLTDNEATGCTLAEAATAGLGVGKTDGRVVAAPGDTYTYTLDVENLLPGEKVTGVVLKDTLPAGLAFVSATGGGTASDQGPEDAYGNQPGGTVTWSLGDLGPAAAPTPGGDGSGGGEDATAEVRVTVRVLPGAEGDIVNTAEVTAPDPADDTKTLTADALDSDGLRTLALTKTSDARASGVSTGDTVTYTVTATNTGTADYTAADPAVVADDLKGVLDDAGFTAGSATATVDDSSPQAVADPDDSVLTWRGALKAGATVTLVYRVKVKDGGDHTLANAAFGAASGTSCDAGTGRDRTGVPCATTSGGFAPTLTKTVRSLAQRDDGRWTVEYGIGVANPNPGGKVTYGLLDDLRFGEGIDVADAEVTGAPDGLSADAEWKGAGSIVTGAELPGGQEHEWTVTVTADAHATAGTPAGRCADGEAAGFANRATLVLTDDTRRTADACAEPAKPSVTKTVDGAPERNEDGSWEIPYLITVANAARTPSGGLAYRLDDTLSLPRGVAVTKVAATGDDAPLNPGFNGGLTTVDGAAVTPDTALLTGTDRVPAATADGPGSRAYRVTVTARTNRELDERDVACGPEGVRGYGNAVTLSSTDAVLATADACADIAVPELRFTKTADKKGPVRPGDVITYTITATNTGDADFVAAEPAVIEDDMTDVLSNADYRDDVEASAGEAVVEAPVLRWSVPIESGGTQTLTYSVEVGDVTEEGRIRNSVTVPGIPATGEPVACPAEATLAPGAVCTVTTDFEPEPEPSPSPSSSEPEPSPSGSSSEPEPSVSASEPETSPSATEPEPSPSASSSGPEPSVSASEPETSPSATKPQPSPSGSSSAAAVPSAGPSPEPTPTKPKGWLPRTGASVAITGAVALLALLVGTITLIAVRRRTPRDGA
ncbi:DUF7927 domain-containing protein [Streptomyces sp. NPDC004838]